MSFCCASLRGVWGPGSRSGAHQGAQMEESGGSNQENTHLSIGDVRGYWGAMDRWQSQQMCGNSTHGPSPRLGMETPNCHNWARIWSRMLGFCCPVCFPPVIGCACEFIMVYMIIAWVMGLWVRFARVVYRIPCGWPGSRGAIQNPAKKATKCKCSILRLPLSCDGPISERTRGCKIGGELSPPLQEKIYGVESQPVCDSVLIPRHGGLLNTTWTKTGVAISI